MTEKYLMPAEWATHDAYWSAWPSHADVWLDDLEPAREEVAGLFRALSNGGEKLHILADGAEAVESARAALRGTSATVHDMLLGDIWLRDTAPIFVEGDKGIVATCFEFNGWGGKYVLPHDSQVCTRICRMGKYETRLTDWVLEGGSIDVDGTGLALTTAQCLLNKNRNPDLSRAEIMERLRDQLGITQLVWLGDGLANDHTDGHIDNLARFISVGTVVVPEARDSDDPNRDIYIAARKALEVAGLTVVVAPSVGRLENDEGEPIPASYMNFVIANSAVVVPTYGTKWDDVALKEFEPLFPGRKIIGSRANHILTGGGSFHCITQQVPSFPIAGV